MGWELHAISAFAGHRSSESTLRYIHLSGRDLADKLTRSMDHIHAWRVEALTRMGTAGQADPVTALSPLPEAGRGFRIVALAGERHRPLRPARDDRR